MPVYTLYAHYLNRKEDLLFANTLTRLHSQTFGTNRDAVRVNLVNGAENSSIFTILEYGGVGYQPSKGMFEREKISECLVVQMDFRGSAAEWEEYCITIVRHRPAIRSIYLQKLDFEFERRDPNLVGRIVTLSREDPSSSV